MKKTLLVTVAGLIFVSLVTIISVTSIPLPVATVSMSRSVNHMPIGSPWEFTDVKDVQFGEEWLRINTLENPSHTKSRDVAFLVERVTWHGGLLKKDVDVLERVFYYYTDDGHRRIFRPKNKHPDIYARAYGGSVRWEEVSSTRLADYKLEIGNCNGEPYISRIDRTYN